jgi:hypothetical protein
MTRISERRGSSGRSRRRRWTMWRIELRSWYLGLKWSILWAVIYALDLEEWADERWYRRYL